MYRAVFARARTRGRDHRFVCFARHAAPPAWHAGTFISLITAGSLSNRPERAIASANASGPQRWCEPGQNIVPSPPSSSALSGQNTLYSRCRAFSRASFICGQENDPAMGDQAAEACGKQRRHVGGYGDG